MTHDRVLSIPVVAFLVVHIPRLDLDAVWVRSGFITDHISPKVSPRTVNTPGEHRGSVEFPLACNRGCARAAATQASRGAPGRKGFAVANDECNSGAPAFYRPHPQSTRALPRYGCGPASLPWLWCSLPTGCVNADPWGSASTA